MAHEGIQTLDFDIRLSHPLLDQVFANGTDDLNGSSSQRFSIEWEGGWGIHGQPFGRRDTQTVKARPPRKVSVEINSA